MDAGKDIRMVENIVPCHTTPRKARPRSGSGMPLRFRIADDNIRNAKESGSD
jgi:hypothetical protein